MSRKKRRNSGGIEVNVTSLVDVAFVLLLVFIIISPALQSGVDIRLPETKGSTVEVKEKSVNVSINEKGTVFMEDKIVAASELTSRLESTGLPPSTPIYIRADKVVDYGIVIDVLASIKNAGYLSVNLLSANRGST